MYFRPDSIKVFPIVSISTSVDSYRYIEFNCNHSGFPFGALYKDRVQPYANVNWLPINVNMLSRVILACSMRRSVQRTMQTWSLIVNIHLIIVISAIIITSLLSEQSFYSVFKKIWAKQGIVSRERSFLLKYNEKHSALKELSALFCIVWTFIVPW